MCTISRNECWASVLHSKSVKCIQGRNRNCHLLSIYCVPGWAGGVCVCM